MSADAPNAEAATVSRGTATEQIMADLQDQILRGKLPRGTRLPNEKELAQRYKVSPNTIREAVRGLAALKMVEPRHGAGTYVTAQAEVMFAAVAASVLEIQRISLFDVLSLLGVLQERAVVLACELAADEELADLTPLLDQLEAAGDQSEFAERLEAFLGGLADASHSPLIAFLTKFLMRLLVEVAREQAGGVRTEFAAKLSADRRKLVDALISRDAKAAVRLAALYHGHAEAMVRAVVSEHGDSGSDHVQQVYRRVRQG